jgi:hypothetical protein
MNQTEDTIPQKTVGPARVGLLALLVAVAAFAIDLPFLYNRAFEFVDIQVATAGPWRIDGEVIQGFRIVNAGSKTADAIAIRLVSLPTWQRGPTLDSLDGCQVGSAGPSGMLIECKRLSPGQERGKGVLVLFALASTQKLYEDQVEVRYSEAGSALPGPRLLWQGFSFLLLFVGMASTIVAIISVLIIGAVLLLRRIRSVRGKIAGLFQEKS